MLCFMLQRRLVPLGGLKRLLCWATRGTGRRRGGSTRTSRLRYLLQTEAVRPSSRTSAPPEPTSPQRLRTPAPAGSESNNRTGFNMEDRNNCNTGTTTWWGNSQSAVLGRPTRRKCVLTAMFVLKKSNTQMVFQQKTFWKDISQIILRIK